MQTFYILIGCGAISYLFYHVVGSINTYSVLPSIFCCLIWIIFILLTLDT